VRVRGLSSIVAAVAEMRRADDELKVAGVAAARAALAMRPMDVRRMFLVESRVPDFRDVLAELAKSRLVYRIVPSDELEKIAGTNHHEGVCVVTAPIEERDFEDLLAIRGEALVLAAPGIENPHNLGAILRVAAHFGVTALLLEETDPRLSAATCRTSEGGAEHVPIVRVPRIADALGRARRAGFTVLGSSSHDGAKDLYDVKTSDRTIWVVGNEARGLPGQVLAVCDAVVRIPGSGHVESLNLATATAILLAEARRPKR